MALNMYGAEGVSGPIKEVVGGAQQAGQRLGSSIFSRPGAFQKEAGRQAKPLRDAIDNFGLDTAIQFSEQSDQMLKQIGDDLKMQRQKAMRARANNDVQEYQLAQQQVMFDKQMAARIDQLGKTRLGQIITSLVTAIGQTAANIGAHVYEKRHPIPNIYDQQAGLMTDIGKLYPGQPASSPWEQQSWNTGSQY